MAISVATPRQSGEEVDRVIRAAIIGKMVVLGTYEGGKRLLCPHMLGRSRAGQRRVLCLQIEGESSSGLKGKDGAGDWRCLTLDKFSNVELTAAVWQTTAASQRRPTCLETVELAVAEGPEQDPQQGH